jgi:hypothetical protein
MGTRQSARAWPAGDTVRTVWRRHFALSFTSSYGAE